VKTYKEYTESPVNEVDSSGIDMYDNKRKESERRKKARETPSSPETQAKLKRARAGEVEMEEASKLPPHLAKFFDKKGDLKPEVAARIAKGREKLNIKDVTPKGYGPKEEASDARIEWKGGGDIKKTFAEITTGLLKRAASAAHKDMEKQKDHHDLAAFDGGRTEREKATKKKAEKREKQSAKFSAAAGEKPAKPESQDSRDKRLSSVKRNMYNSYTSTEEPVDELSKGLLQRAQQSAKAKAGQQRAVSAKAASRVGDTSQPPGQNLKSKRADFKAAKKDYQAFKFGKAANKKTGNVEKEEWEKPRDKDFEKLGPLSKGEMKGKSKYSGKSDEKKEQNESHDYFGSGPFTGPKSDLAASVLRIAEKAAKDKEDVEEVKGFEKMSNDKLNQSVKDAYLDKVRGGM